MERVIYILTGIVLLSLFSCSDFLEPKFQSEYVPKDTNALQEMPIGSVYPKQDKGNFLLPFLSFLNGDIQFHKTDYEFSINSLEDVEAKQVAYTWRPDMFFIMERNSYPLQNIREGYHNYILGANAALDYIGDVNGTETEKNYVIAQSLGLRAFYCFMLANHSGVPYNYDKQVLGTPLKLDGNLSLEDQLLVIRNTVEEVYNQIVDDLNEAECLFLTLSKDRQYEPNYLVSLPVIQLLKLRVSLYMENWKDVAIYANRIIKDWSPALTDLNDLPSPTVTGLCYNFTSLKSSEVIWLYESVLDLTVFNDQSVEYEEEGYFGNITYYREVSIVSDNLTESFEDGGLRKEKYIAKEFSKNDEVFYEDSYTISGKYKLSATGKSSGSENFVLSSRLGEAYLNLAETAAHNNDESITLSALKTLLAKRYEPDKSAEPTGLTGDMLKAFIKNERRKELCFEGRRWFDLRRYGISQIVHKWGKQIYTSKQNDPSCTMPIPDAVLIKNKRLEQSPLASKRGN